MELTDPILSTIQFVGSDVSESDIVIVTDIRLRSSLLSIVKYAMTCHNIVVFDLSYNDRL